MLTDLQCKNATCPAGKKSLKLYDADGLYLLVAANSKRWMYKYRFAKREKLMALGSYPAVSLTAARKAMAAAKQLKGTGVDPMASRKVEKLKGMVTAGDSFKEVALEWLQKQVPMWSDSHAKRSTRQLERDLFPYLGARKMADVLPFELLATLRKIEGRGAVETAHRGLMLARQVWRYAVATARAPRDITGDLVGSLSPFRGKHFAAVTEPAALGTLLRAIKAYRGGAVVKSALELAPLLFQRPGELRAAEWSEFDLDAGLWTIPAARMKREKEGKEYGEPHLVPLARQAVEILRELHARTGNGRLVFPGQRDHGRAISDNSVRTALIAMGYTPELQTWHGFRATARTMLAERLGFDPLVIEAQLAHAVKDANGRAYNRTTYLDQRKKMMQAWADYLDTLRSGAQVLQLRVA